MAKKREPIRISGRLGPWQSDEFIKIGPLSGGIMDLLDRFNEAATKKGKKGKKLTMRDLYPERYAYEKKGDPGAAQAAIDRAGPQDAMGYPVSTTGPVYSDVNPNRYSADPDAIRGVVDAAGPRDAWGYPLQTTQTPVSINDSYPSDVYGVPAPTPNPAFAGNPDAIQQILDDISPGMGLKETLNPEMMGPELTEPFEEMTYGPPGRGSLHHPGLYQTPLTSGPPSRAHGSPQEPLTSGPPTRGGPGPTGPMGPMTYGPEGRASRPPSEEALRQMLSPGDAGSQAVLSAQLPNAVYGSAMSPNTPDRTKDDERYGVPSFLDTVASQVPDSVSDWFNTKKEAFAAGMTEAGVRAHPRSPQEAADFAKKPTWMDIHQPEFSKKVKRFVPDLVQAAKDMQPTDVNDAIKTAWDYFNDNDGTADAKPKGGGTATTPAAATPADVALAPPNAAQAAIDAAPRVVETPDGDTVVADPEATSLTALEDYQKLVRSALGNVDVTPDNPKQAEADAYAERQLSRDKMLAQLAIAAGLTRSGGKGWSDIASGMENAGKAYDAGFERYQSALQKSADRYETRQGRDLEFELGIRKSAFEMAIADRKEAAVAAREARKEATANIWKGLELRKDLLKRPDDAMPLSPEEEAFEREIREQLALEAQQHQGTVPSRRVDARGK